MFLPSDWILEIGPFWIFEKSDFFDNNLLILEDNKYIDGYFQCEKYFKDIREIILKQFTINQDISNYTKEIKNKIQNAALTN